MAGGRHASRRYDVESRAWSTLAPLPELREGFSVAVHGGEVYVVGGVSTSERAPPLVLRDDAWEELEGAPDDLSCLERPAVASVVLG